MTITKNKFRICQDCSNPAFKELDTLNKPVWFCATCNKNWTRETFIHKSCKYFKALGVILLIAGTVGGLSLLIINQNEFNKKQAKIEQEQSEKKEIELNKVQNFAVIIDEKYNPYPLVKLLKIESVKQGKDFALLTVDIETNTIHILCTEKVIEAVPRICLFDYRKEIN